jgi:protein TonB
MNRYLAILAVACLSLACLAQSPAPDDPGSLNRRIRISSNILPGFLEHGQNPEYPEQAISQGTHGDVILQILIDTDGHVARASVVQGDPLLVPAAVDALNKFRFRPYLLNGSPVAVESKVGFRFKLKKEPNTSYFFDIDSR